MKLEPSKHIIKITSAGRIHIPVPLYSRLDLHLGDSMLLEQIDDKSFTVTKVELLKRNEYLDLGNRMLDGSDKKE